MCGVVCCGGRDVAVMVVAGSVRKVCRWIRMTSSQQRAGWGAGRSPRSRRALVMSDTFSVAAKKERQGFNPTHREC